VFNVFNAQFLTCGGDAFGDCIPFNNDISNSNLGKWTGTVPTHEIFSSSADSRSEGVAA
jgi:hypothetical protein